MGLVTGIAVTFFRIFLDFSIHDTSFHFHQSFLNNSPIIGYYFVFALTLSLGQATRFLEYPFYIGVLGAFGDGVANITELLIRTEISGQFMLHATNIEYVFIIAILRSFFVVGLFNMVYMNHMKVVYKEQRSRFEQIQMITSGLYVEVFYLKKLMNNIEEVTAKGFSLYQKIKGYPEVPQNISQTALAVAQEVHEIKKDNQRILAGLEKIIHQESAIIQMTIDELIDLVIRANRKYAKMLNKDIYFIQDINADLKVAKVYDIVVILNNLITNSIEAIKYEGVIKIYASVTEQYLEMRITDNGSGIHKEDESLVFEPGFTTKFDEKGRQSTGIGLSHVKSMVYKLGGEIELITDQISVETIFKVTFPIDQL